MAATVFISDALINFEGREGREGRGGGVRKMTEC